MTSRKSWTPWLWLSPALLLLGVFLIYPTLDTVRRSFLDARSRNFAGLDNFRFLVDNPAPLVAATHAAVLNNLLWLPVFTGLTVGLGLAIAFLAGRVRYEAVVMSAVFVPMAISFLAASVIWRFMYEFNPAIGTLNAALTGLGRDATAWLQNTGSPWSWLTSAGPGSLPAPFQLNNFAL